MTETFAEVSSKRHGIFGRKIEYQTNLSLKEIEDRLHQAHDGHTPSIGGFARPNEFNYPHPTTLICEMIALQRIDTRIVIILSRAKGKAIREGNSKITNVKFTVKAGIEAWLIELGFIILLLFSLYVVNNPTLATIFSIGAIIGFIVYLYLIYKETRKLANLAEEIFL